MKKDKEKKKDKNNNEVSLGTLYDFNKQIISKMKKMDETAIEKIKPQIEDWFNWQLDGYAMLLCRERYDFTIFHLYENEQPNPCAVAAKELIDLLKSRGKIISIEKDDNTMNNAWEIWLRIGDDVYAYYLFCCDDWVIEC